MRSLAWCLNLLTGCTVGGLVLCLGVACAARHAVGQNGKVPYRWVPIASQISMATLSPPLEPIA